MDDDDTIPKLECFDQAEKFCDDDQGFDADESSELTTNRRFEKNAKRFKRSTVKNISKQEAIENHETRIFDEGIEVDDSPEMTPLKSKNSMNRSAKFEPYKKVEKRSVEFPKEQTVFQIIAKSKKNGIWVRDIQDSSGLTPMQLKKSLIDLEARNLIKPVKIAGTTRKYYILSEIEPDLSTVYQFSEEVPRYSNRQPSMEFSLLQNVLKIRGMDNVSAIRIVMMKSSLDQLLPFIPPKTRGGMNEFTSHFMKLLKEAHEKQYSAEQLVEKSLDTFQTVVKMVKMIPSCVPTLKKLYKKHPNYFDPTDPL